MTVPASNAVAIFIIASHVCRAITMAGCRVHSTAIPRNKIAASASIGGEAVVSDIELAWLRECQQTGRFPLRKWHRYGPNDHFDRGLKPASLLQHEMLADVRVGSFTSFSRCPRYVRSSPNSGGKADVAALLIRAITGHRPTATRSPRRRPQAVCPARSGRACGR